MNNSEFEQAIEIALRTWYPKDHELHLNPHHPLGKLLGEWGELLDDYMKSLYKPGYRFEPENELGDIWYYLRVLCYQKNIALHAGSNICPSTDILIAKTMIKISEVFKSLCYGYSINKKLWEELLNFSYSALLRICNQHNITLQQLTKSNWQKLKPGSERGEQWMKAR